MILTAIALERRVPTKCDFRALNPQSLNVLKPPAEAVILPRKIALNGIVPQINRRVEVPPDFSPLDFLFTIQDAKPWKCGHLCEFKIRGLCFGSTQPLNGPDGFGMIDDVTKSLASLIYSKGDRFLYTYDFGDNWRHRITVEKSSTRIPIRPARD